MKDRMQLQIAINEMEQNRNRSFRCEEPRANSKNMQRQRLCNFTLPVKVFVIGRLQNWHRG